MNSSKLAGLLIVASFLGACGPASLEFRQGAATAQNNANGTLSCTPTGTGGSAFGIEGTLYYLPSGATPLNNVADYISTGTKGTTTYFWNQIDFQEAYYTMGFPQGNGGLVQTNSGQTLTQNFAFDMRTQIGLSSTDTAGDYQFALLSDDGSVLNLANSSGNFQTIVNNDGQHAEQLGCATSVVHLDSTTQLTAQIEYYQGPLDYTGVILLWKKIPTGGALDTTYCGQGGTNFFFTPATSATSPATPLAPYNTLLSRGWAPLKAGNFSLPGSSNSCI